MSMTGSDGSGLAVAAQQAKRDSRRDCGRSKLIPARRPGTIQGGIPGLGTRGTSRTAIAAAFAAIAGCDPVVNIAGANFPAWLVCAIAGGIAAALIRPIFLAARIEPYLGPLPVVYPCLAILIACAAYLVFFNRV
jgi:hypothetical protein